MSFLANMVYQKEIKGRAMRFFNLLLLGAISLASEVSLADAQAPILESWSLSPTEIDTSASEAEVVATFRITDASGAKIPNVAARHSSGQTSGFASVVRTSGDAVDGIYEASITVAKGSAPGAWTVSLYPLEDELGNRSSGFGPGPGFVSGFCNEELDSDSDGLCNDEDVDDDNDGVLDSADAFPLDATETLDTDSDGTGNNADTDDDGDGVADGSDALPLDATETLDTDSDGTGNNADTDDDGDGVLDSKDAYALISLGGRIDTDGDGYPNDCDATCEATGMLADSDDDNDGVEDTSDAFPLDATETADSDADGVGDNSDAFPDDAAESVDSDSDSVGDNADNCPSLSNTSQLNTDGDSEGDACDSDDDNDGFSDDQEEQDGTDPLNRFSCKSGCFSFDVDESLEAQPLTDGLLVIRHLFGFSGDSLTSGAVSGEAGRDSSEAIASYLTDADSELDIDGDGESKPLTDGLLLIRYLFGFSGDSLISGAIGSGAERDTAEEVEAYIKERVPAL
jgi:hypothetical protein